VAFSRFSEKKLELTGPFAKEGRGGLQEISQFRLKRTGLWSYAGSTRFFMEWVMCLRIVVRKQSKISGCRL